jgi:hypothetical protein
MDLATTANLYAAITAAMLMIKQSISSHPGACGSAPCHSFTTTDCGGVPKAYIKREKVSLSNDLNWLSISQDAAATTIGATAKVMFRGDGIRD